mmetsp:Transcript_41061/g.90077  ORF Transcript_41061/g.90077 Transcript_41061/m.90077 type:complete len:165 (-) Transcript_41061:379-873(-)
MKLLVASLLALTHYVAAFGALHKAAAVQINGAARPAGHLQKLCVRDVRRMHSPVLREYSTKVKITAESRAPLRQARIFFFYPSTIAGASVALYVSVTRLIAGLGGFRDDLVPLNDAGNLFVDAGVIAAAVWFLRADLKARSEQLEEVALELEGPPPKEKGGLEE